MGKINQLVLMFAFASLFVEPKKKSLQKKKGQKIQQDHIFPPISNPATPFSSK